MRTAPTLAVHSGSGAPFEVLGPIRHLTTIAVGRRIRELDRLVKRYGTGDWRKRKGDATVRLPGGSLREAELHWYEAQGLGRKEMKMKRYLDQ